MLLPTSYWYIWALPVYHAVALWLWNIFGKESSYVVAVLAILSFFAPKILAITQGIVPDPLDAFKLDSVAANAVWFFCGLHFRSTWLRMVESATRSRMCIAMLAFIAAYACARALGTAEVYFLKPVLAVLALFLASQVLGLMTFKGSVAAVVSWIGRLTLPVYILHIFAISILSAAIKIIGFTSIMRAYPATTDFFITPVLAGIVLLSARVIGHVVVRSPAKWLFVPISSFTRSTDTNASLGLVEKA